MNPITEIADEMDKCAEVLTVADQCAAALAFQNFSARLRAIAAPVAGGQEPVAFRCRRSNYNDGEWDYVDGRSPDSYELRECEIQSLYTHPAASSAEPVRDCGEAGHTEGRCGNAGCFNSKRIFVAGGQEFEGLMQDLVDEYATDGEFKKSKRAAVMAAYAQAAQKARDESALKESALSLVERAQAQAAQAVKVPQPWTLRHMESWRHAQNCTMLDAEEPDVCCTCGLDKAREFLRLNAPDAKEGS